jgi:Ser/Thr protein kinase RdoA (MazF antagonist)
MDDSVVWKVLGYYGLQSGRLLPMQRGYRNESHPLELPDGSRANLILYKTEVGIVHRIRRANAVANYLAEQGMPARRTLDPRIVQLEARDRTKYGALYAYLPGETIPWEAYTQAHLKALGQALGDMHYHLTEYSGEPLPDAAEDYLAITGRMEGYFADPQVAKAMRQKLHLLPAAHAVTRLRRVLRGCTRLPHQQALHMDFVRGNVLFAADATITGILDFEKTAQGHPLFDLARTLAFLLVDCKYKQEAKVRKYFLESGYNKRGHGTFKVTIQNTALLDRLTDLFLLHDFYKFLRHNPYESLHENEHYTRTAALLVRRGLLTAA